MLKKMYFIAFIQHLSRIRRSLLRGRRVFKKILSAGSNIPLKGAGFIFALIWIGITPQEAFLQQKDVASFYKGATLRLIVPQSPGGAYDIWLRTLAPYMSKQTGARIIIENMPGAGGLAGGGYLYALAKPDGLTLAIFPIPGMALGEMLEFDAVKYEMDNFTYIGRVEVGDRGLFTSKASNLKTIADMQRSPKPIRFGVLDLTSQSSIEKALMAEALGMKAKIIPGYKGSKEYMLAVIAGRELDSASTTISAFIDNVKRGDLNLVAMMGKKRHHAFPETPTLLETPGLKPEGKRLLDIITVLTEGGRMIVGPPGLPEEKRLFLEKALMASLKEPGLIDWANKNDFNIDPLTGKECKALISVLKEVVPKAERPKFKHLTTEKYL